ncbi:hypothetical protein LPJ73_004284 [Coemansia sp. RSA 2703]|nr:hypothetical protein LPJ73_004284 [Coemansia sp. RSA 2703]KAJ2375411.1 hypothetical protein IW150_002559 [Coemansia sp. RSA 2607]KAJ2388155.1 hypothetical protein GGI05_003868 [Coemansia sp. RSA 2603]
MNAIRALSNKHAAGMLRAFGTSAWRHNPYPYKITRVTQPDKSATAITFGTTSKNIKETAVIGWLRHTNIDPLAIDGQQMRPQDFSENRLFWPQVQQILEKYAHEDPELQSQAAFFKSGWMNISDGRNPPPPGRTGDPEDILGSVLVEDKKIKQGSFQANLAHRLVTRDGLFQLPKYLQQKLADFSSL